MWGKPFYFLLFFMAVALGLMIWLMQGPFRTRAGDQALEELQTALKQRGEKAFHGTSVLEGASLALAVGLFGVLMMIIRVRGVIACCTASHGMA